jgi:nickel transport system ATP-binding protein
VDNRDAILDVRAIEIELLSEKSRSTVVQDLSFTINKGQVLGIVGQSGCGKSMTCMTILGLLPKAARMTGGSILLNGTSLTILSRKELMMIRRRQLSLVLQNPMTAFNPLKTIGSQFIETLRLQGKYTRIEALGKAIKHLEDMNLADPDRVLRQYPFELSGGMLQRVMIGLAISKQPSLLIADEPTTALDTNNQEHVISAMRRIKAGGETGILLVSHDLNVIEALADRVIVMKQGKVVESGLSKEVIYHPKEEYTKLLCESRLALRTPVQDRRFEGIEVV